MRYIRAIDLVMLLAVMAVVSACKTPGKGHLLATGGGAGWGGCDSVTTESRPRPNERRVESLQRLLSIKEFLLKQEASAAVLVTEEGVMTGKDATEVAREAGLNDPASEEAKRFEERANKGEIVRDRTTGQIKEAATLAKEKAVRMTFGSRLADAIDVAHDFVEQGGNKAEAISSLKNMDMVLQERMRAQDAFAQDVHGGKIRLDVALAALDPATINEATLKTNIDRVMNEYYSRAGAQRAVAAELIAKYLIEAETSARLANKVAVADMLYARAETATGGNIGLLNNYRLGAYETAVFSSLKNGNPTRSQAAVEAMNAFVSRVSSSGATEVAKDVAEMREIAKKAVAEMPRKESYMKAREALTRMRIRLETRPEFKPRTRI